MTYAMRDVTVMASYLWCGIWQLFWFVSCETGKK